MELRGCNYRVQILQARSAATLRWFLSFTLPGLCYSGMGGALFSIPLLHSYSDKRAKGEKRGSQMQRHCRTGNMAGVGFDPIPLRATRFKCMTECKKTGANGYPGRVQRSDGKGQRKRKGAASFPIVAARLSFPATHFFSWKKKKKKSL